MPVECDSLPSYLYWSLFQHEVSWSEVALAPPNFVVIFVLASPAGLFLQFCPCTWGIVLWGALVASHGSFGWPVIFLNFMEFLLSWSMRIVCFRLECLQNIIPSFGFFKESSNSSPKSLCPDQTCLYPCIHCLNQTKGIFSLIIGILVPSE